MSFWKWATVAASNSTADGSINWAEGQAPSSVNDSARGMMAASAKWRDDISGAITTGGSATAYTVTSNQSFDTLAHMANAMIAFVPHATNTNAFDASTAADITLAVDGLAAKPIRIRPGIPIPDGALVLGTPYVVTYNNSDAMFYLHNMENPYHVPLGASIQYWGATAPNSAFVIPIGQAISRTVYSGLFTLFSTLYGTGNGSTTFNLPDLRGRTPVGADASASRITTAVYDKVTIGGVGGAQTATLVAGNLPQFTPSVASVGSQTITDSRTWTTTIGTTTVQGTVTLPARAYATTGTTVNSAVSQGSNVGVSDPVTFNTVLSNTTVTFGTISTTPSGVITVNQPLITMNPSGSASPTAITNTQPSIVCNHILRII